MYISDIYLLYLQKLQNFVHPRHQSPWDNSNLDRNFGWISGDTPCRVENTNSVTHNMAPTDTFPVACEKCAICVMLEGCLNIIPVVYRCTVIKVPHPKREAGPVLLLQNYPHPLSLRGRGPYYFPTPLST